MDETQQDPELSKEQELKVTQLTEQDLQNIDTALIACCKKNWRKVARVVGTAMGEQESRVLGIPDIFYAKRVRLLVQSGVLESQGDLSRMRFSEVRLKSV